MEVIRTPDEHFRNLPEYDFEPHYVEVPDGDGGSLRIHFVDEGPSSGAPILCLHGQPTWSFLYRKMIARFVSAGHRVIAPDLVGFGRSDKPVQREDYTYARHVAWMQSWLEKLDLCDITLVCQDWGGLIGLRLVAALPDRFARVVAANTALSDGTGVPDDAAPSMRKLYESLPVLTMPEVVEKFHTNQGAPGFFYWRKYCAEVQELRIRDIMGIATTEPLPDEVLAAYEAPFPDQRYLAGARAFPSLVPIFPDDPAIEDNRRAWASLRTFDKPFLTAFSDGDPVTRGREKRFQEEVPGAHGRNHVTIHGAGHFLQEEAGEELADVVSQFIVDNPR